MSTMSGERDVWDHADLAWHGLFYLLLVIPAVLATVNDPRPGAWLPMLALVAGTIAWHAAFALPGHTPGVDPPLWRGLLALAGSCAGALVLLGSSREFTLSVYGLIPQAFILLGRWGMVGAAAVVVAIWLRAGAFNQAGANELELAGAIVMATALGAFVHLIARQSMRRREALEALAAARVELDEAARREGVLAERQRLAGEVHDTVAQLMVGVVTQLEAAQRAIPADGERVRSHLDRAVAAARDGLGELRAAVEAIRPDALTGGLVPAAHSAAHRWSTDTGLPVEVRVQGEPAPLSSDAAHALLRGVQEALANVARHAEATGVRLTIGAANGRVTVRVADDGRGFRRRADRLRADRDAGPARRGRRHDVDRHRAGVRHHRHHAGGRVITVLLVDDHPVVRDGLRGMLADEPGIEVVGAAGDGREAIAAARRLGPDVVLMDLRMPGMDGVAATRELREMLPDARVLVLTTFDSDRDIERAIAAGAVGYLLKDAPRADLVRGVRAAARGEAALAPTVAARLMARSVTPTPEPLTARERQVLTLVADGLTNRQIGRRLRVSETTVKTHLVRTFAKLGVDDRTAAVTAALQRGLLDLGL